MSGYSLPIPHYKPTDMPLGLGEEKVRIFFFRTKMLIGP